MAQNKKISATFVDFYYNSLSQAPQKIADVYTPNARITLSLAGKSFPSSISKGTAAAVFAEKFSSLSHVSIDMISEILQNDVFEVKVTGSFSFHDETPKTHFIHNFTLVQLKEATFALQKDELLPGRETMNWADDSPEVFAMVGDTSAIPHLGMPSSAAVEETARQAKADAEKAAKKAAADAKAAEEAAAKKAAAAEAKAKADADKAAAAAAVASKEAEAKAAADAADAEEKAAAAAKAAAEAAAAKKAAAEAKAAEDEDRRIREEAAKIDVSKLSLADRMRYREGLPLSAPKPVVAAPAQQEAATEEQKPKKSAAAAKAGTPISTTNEKTESGAPILYDLFIRGMPESASQEDVHSAIKIEATHVATMYKSVKIDKTHVERTFIFVRLNRETIPDVAAFVAEVLKKSAEGGNRKNKITVEQIKDKEVFATPVNPRPARREPAEKKPTAVAEAAPEKKAAVPTGTSIKIKPASNPWGKAAATAPAQ